MSKKLVQFGFWLIGLGMLISAAAPARARPRQTEVRNGTISTRPGRRLRLSTELGSVEIRTGKADQVSYRAEIETDSSGEAAERGLKGFAVSARADSEGVEITGRTSSARRSGGRLWVNFLVVVPVNYNLEVETGGGNIEVADIDGRLSLTTSGGNLTAGRIGGTARLRTDGGHVLVKDVAGDLTAETAGGHINVGNVRGNAVLQTGGGHIHAGYVSGAARLETGGGNISLEHAGRGVVADTGGGQIELGEASGALRASTGGGGIRVLRVAGPTQLDTGGGSIFMTQVGNAVHASTGAGGITAWFDPKGKTEAPSQLECDQGDIVVYLPRELPITIDAAIEEGGEHTIIVDPAFPLKVTYGDSSEGSHIVRAEGSLNGGGRVLHLKTTAGNIRLLLSDQAQQLYRQQLEELQKKLEIDRQRLEQQMQDLQERLRPKPEASAPPAPVPPEV